MIAEAIEPVHCRISPRDTVEVTPVATEHLANVNPLGFENLHGGPFD